MLSFILLPLYCTTIWLFVLMHFRNYWLFVYCKWPCNVCYFGAIVSEDIPLTCMSLLIFGLFNVLFSNYYLEIGLLRYKEEEGKLIINPQICVTDSVRSVLWSWPYQLRCFPSINSNEEAVPRSLLIFLFRIVSLQGCENVINSSMYKSTNKCSKISV